MHQNPSHRKRSRCNKYFQQICWEASTQCLGETQAESINKNWNLQSLFWSLVCTCTVQLAKCTPSLQHRAWVKLSDEFCHGYWCCNCFVLLMLHPAEMGVPWAQAPEASPSPAPANTSPWWWPWAALVPADGSWSRGLGKVRHAAAPFSWEACCHGLVCSKGPRAWAAHRSKPALAGGAQHLLLMFATLHRKHLPAKLLPLSINSSERRDAFPSKSKLRREKKKYWFWKKLSAEQTNEMFTLITGVTVQECSLHHHSSYSPQSYSSGDQQDGSFPSNSSFPVFSESLGRKKYQKQVWSRGKQLFSYI